MSLPSYLDLDMDDFDNAKEQRRFSPTTAFRNAQSPAQSTSAKTLTNASNTNVPTTGHDMTSYTYNTFNSTHPTTARILNNSSQLPTLQKPTPAITPAVASAAATDNAMATAHQKSPFGSQIPRAISPATRFTATGHANVTDTNVNGNSSAPLRRLSNIALNGSSSLPQHSSTAKTPLKLTPMIRKTTTLKNNPNTVSMASIPRPAIKSTSSITTSTSTSASKSSPVELPSDPSDSDSDTDIDIHTTNRSFTTSTQNNNTMSQQPGPEPQPQTQAPAPARTLAPVPAPAPAPVSAAPKFPSNTLKKFSYNDSDDNDSDDDDDIVITGVSNVGSSFGNSSFNNGNNSGTITGGSFVKNEPSIMANGSLKRSFNEIQPPAIQDNTQEMAQKRQQVLDNKLTIVEDNIKKEREKQKVIKEKAEQELQMQRKIKINELLRGYPPLRQLPDKYQVDFPKISNFAPEVAAILPANITTGELLQERNSMVPAEYRVATFRNEHLKMMSSIVHRANRFMDIQSRMSIFLQNAAKVHNDIRDKADKFYGNKKADLRYNQILRFMEPRIKLLSKWYGDVSNTLINLRRLKQDLIIRSRACETIRREIIARGRSTLLAKPVEDFMKLIPEVKLLTDSIKVMCQFKDATTDPIPFIRQFSLTCPLPPKIPLPQLPPQKQIKPHLSVHSNQIDLVDLDDPYSLLHTTPIMPLSNIYNDPSSNPYRNGAGDDAEGIKNLMESIKVIEFEEEGLAKTPSELSISLLKHQRIGLSWMLKLEEGPNKGGILADDMGLGKTVQAISLILANKPQDLARKTTLIVGPVSLLQQWQQEIHMKIHTDKRVTTYLFHATNKVKTFKELAEFDIVLVSFQTLGSEWKKHYGSMPDADDDDDDANAHYMTYAEKIEREKRKQQKKVEGRHNSPFYTKDAMFFRVILDEAQYIKNRNTIASRAVSFLTSKYRWCLSGTPIQNKIEELYPLIRFLDIKPYNDWPKFNHQIVTSIKKHYNSGHKKIHALLSAVLLRRTKDSVIDGKPILTLPEKHLIEEEVEMEDDEKKFYASLESASQATADKLLNSAASSRSYSSILTLLLRMRQACDHEYLVRLGDDGDRVDRLNKFTKGWQALEAYDPRVLERIERDRQFGYTCLNCKDELAGEQTLFLSKCGHAICKDCHEEYFQDNSETTAATTTETEISAKCSKCQTTNLSSMSVDLILFDKYQDGYTWQQVRKEFELDSKAGDKHWRAKMIQEFIETDGKLIVSAKAKKSIELINKILENNSEEKTIVFSQFMGYFDVLKILLQKNGIEFLQYDGSMDMGSKNDCINAFYKDPMKKVLLLSLKAGNVGLTLTCANHVIISEPFWNPYVEKQAQDRVHRISQTKEVFVHRLLIKGTIEDRIMELQKEKEALVEGALDPTARTKIGKLSRRELGFLFGLNGLAELEDDR